MRKLLITLCFLLAVPLTVFAQNDTREFNGYFWYDDGIHLVYPLTVADDAVSTFFPMTSDTNVPEGAQPERVQINFQDYSEADGWTLTGGSINVMLVSTFPGDDQPATQVLNGTRDLLAAGDFDAAIAGGIPSFSQLTSSQIFTAQETRLDFQTGTGVRFITAGALDVGPIVNGMVYYSYEGLTSDGQYYVSAQFPLHTSLLPDEYPTMDADQYNAFAERYEAYIAETQASLDAATADFSPTLAELDGIIQSLSVSGPEAMFSTNATNGVVDYDGIHFSYDPSLAYRVEVDHVEAVTGAAAENTMFGVAPSYRLFSLVGYPEIGSFQVAQLYVFPVTEFPAADTAYGSELATLQSLLAERPELLPTAVGNLTPPLRLPMLPPINAAQVIVAQPEYISAEGGEGVRYITYYAQGLNVVSMNDLFYAYAGLSADGQYAFAAHFPLSASFLPPAEVANEIADYDQFVADYQPYLADILAQTEAADDTQLTPSVNLLDAVVSSLRID